MLQILLPLLFGLIDKILPNEEARAASKLELMKAENQQVLNDMQARMAAILAEASSTDPWTSRARPSFLYVVYILLLASLPMGVVYAHDPILAAHITEGFKAWLNAIPEPIIQLFGVVMLGYIGGRSWEKVKGAAK